MPASEFHNITFRSVLILVKTCSVFFHHEDNEDGPGRILDIKDVILSGAIIIQGPSTLNNDHQSGTMCGVGSHCTCSHFFWLIVRV